jgi:hypothetical protein
VAIAAVLDEGRLERGFDPRYLGEVDVSPELLVALALEIKLFNPISVDHRHTRFFGVGGVD